MKERILTFCFVLLVLSLIQNLLGCAGGSPGIDKTSNSALVISSAGTIPVIKNSATTTKLFVYNNSDKTITDINYKVSGNQLESTNYMVLGSECKSIIAHSSCALTITTPWLNDKEHSGSSMIFAYYDTKVSKQLINYRVVSDGEIAYSDESLPISKEMTVYAYNSTDKEVIVESLSYSGVKLVNNAEFSIGETLPAGKVIAMALESESLQSASYIALSTEAKNKQTYTSRLELLSQTRSDQGAVLVAGNVPVFNTYGSSVRGMITIQNVGQSTASNVLISSDSTKLNIISNTCANNINSTVSCTVVFTINDDSLKNNGNISIRYDGGVSGYSPLKVPIYWYNQYQTPLINASQTGILAQVSKSSIGSVLVTNSGSYDVSNIIATYISTSGLVTISSGVVNCTNGQTAKLLANSGNSCTLSASYLANSSLDDTIKVVISGNYGSAQVYSRVLLISFKAGAITSNSGAISAAVALTSSSVVTVTNNSLMTYSNISVIESSANGVTVTSASPTVTCSGRGNTLPPGGTCSYPVVAYAESIINTSITTYINLQSPVGISYLFATASQFSISSYYMYYSTGNANKIGYCQLDLNGGLIQESSCAYASVSGCSLNTSTGVRAVGGNLLLAQYRSSDLCKCNTASSNSVLNCTSNMIPRNYISSPRGITDNNNILYVNNQNSVTQSTLIGESPTMNIIPAGRNNITEFFNNQLTYISSESGIQSCFVNQTTGAIISCTMLTNIGLPERTSFYGLAISKDNSMLYIGINPISNSSNLNPIYGCSLSVTGIVSNCSPVTITGTKAFASGDQFNFISAINIIGGNIYILEHGTSTTGIYQCTFINKLTFKCDSFITNNMTRIELMHVPGK